MLWEWDHGTEIPFRTRGLSSLDPLAIRAFIRLKQGLSLTVTLLGEVPLLLAQHFELAELVGLGGPQVW